MAEPAEQPYASEPGCEEPRGEELISRYRANYGIDEGAELTEEMILRHWDLERRLRRELLSSSTENRREVFEECYTRLYGELEWLNRLTDSASAEPAEKRYADWLGSIGDPPGRLFELGPGRGELITLLAERGFDCTAAEITGERGKGAAGMAAGTVPGVAGPDAKITWHETDGVHLDRYEEPGGFDLVISSQVIEHLHPDDLEEHFRSAYTILSSGGRYILSTPHALAGPADISRVFGCDEPRGMHLKEYTYRELASAAGKAGFDRLAAPLRFPGAARPPVTSSVYLSYLVGLEALLGLAPRGKARQRVARAARILYFSSYLMMVAAKD